MVNKFEIVDTFNWLFSVDQNSFNLEITLSTRSEVPGKLKANCAKRGYSQF
jgi:hypothetical protein